jgi:hypothetical protein
MSALWATSGPNTALSARSGAGELRTSSVFDPPGWAATAIVEEPASASLRCSS